jgi:aminopeptidase N
VGEAPYPSAALAVVEGEVPGGHSPAYFAMLNSPPMASPMTWENDPAWFQGFPEFFLAHELAHQWWGHAIGWKNYHEQWISEGFSQYFAALYAQTIRGDRVFHEMLRQFRRWSLSESSYGPIYLGQRLGQVRGGPRVYRALVYNKGAAVLHMLRRIVGDDVFFRGLRRFYRTHRFQTAGTDDLRRAFEAESGRSLERFFDRWIYGTDIPRIGYRVTRGPQDVTIQFEQSGSAIFDVPITVTLIPEAGEPQEQLVVMNDRRLTVTLPTQGRARQVRLNRDSAALAEFDEQ